MSESLVDRINWLVVHRGLARGLGASLQRAASESFVAVLEGATDDDIVKLNETWCELGGAGDEEASDRPPPDRGSLRNAEVQLWERGDGERLKFAIVDGHLLLSEALLAQLLLDAGWERTS